MTGLPHMRAALAWIEHLDCMLPTLVFTSMVVWWGS